MEIRYTLLSDGSSDRALMPILTWLLRKHAVNCAIQPEWADLRRLPRPPKKLSEKICRSIELWPCDLLFIHRDAENQTHGQRLKETNVGIKEAEIIKKSVLPPAICVIPVRMQEAWLLFNEHALRQASGNPNGKQPVKMPPLNHVEELPNPKETLHKLLIDVSGCKGRKLKKFRPREKAIIIANFIDDFSPLDNLSAFKALESSIQQIVQDQGWSW